MKKKIIAITLLSIMAMGSITALSGCGENSDSSISSEVTKEYVEETQITELFTNPDNFSGKYVTLTGMVFAQPEHEGEETYLQIFHNTETSTQNFIAYGITDESFSTGDYVKIDGKVSGTFSGENAFGGTIICPLISEAMIEKSSYIDVVRPTIAKVTPQKATIKQQDLTLKIKKIEFAEKETRVYVEADNQSSNKCYIDIYNAAIVQDGKQIKQDASSISTYQGNYDTLSYDLLAGASDSGILVFPKIDHKKDFTINIEAHSDDYNIQFSAFKFSIEVN